MAKLLDICVKNCGYPFHLQIATKDFLNELVRRFPEKPPARPSMIQLKILGLIEEWRRTICTSSRHKDDFGFIRDMHRLLHYKGYLFPEVSSNSTTVMNSENLKSADELEEEDRTVQSAKLQELIRRGTPADLAEANELMKIMTGYDELNRPDYRAEAAEVLWKLQRKASLLDEMLDGVRKGEVIGHGDVYEELADSLKSAQPKVQKMVSEETDDPEAVEKLLNLNDQINTTLSRYIAIKKGDYSSISSIGQGDSTGKYLSSADVASQLSLIDLDGSTDCTQSSISTQAPAIKNKASEDLLGLSFDGPAQSSWGQGGDISLGPSVIPTSTQNLPATMSRLNSTSSVSSFVTPSVSDSNSQLVGGGPSKVCFGFDFTDKQEVILFDQSPLYITSSVQKGQAQQPSLLVIKFTNISPIYEITQLSFQAAVSKKLSMQIETPNSQEIAPLQRDGIVQRIYINGLQSTDRELKLRWKITYIINAQQSENGGEFVLAV
ncbi:putative ADP-ribosylation factor-binding protein [Neolecta irregularis DAH-3]|uniref:Putative ADP-ribosylation factor-binding protein n=1 Tax=Neolecta irregularis (strain DAH-3) TaxID=1198029 RepID=A0A1U7LU33_NEOID|nr:putative ADP-ribosylation factor-binding protein [Neolecta irregularis DAH-3]|eukprot:OLL26052.1 putative ADP-ribosylation factor-binding protein [Neolecta irregularis DAH-3]